jgi:Staphylococcal nuclease homologue
MDPESGSGGAKRGEHGKTYLPSILLGPRRFARTSHSLSHLRRRMVGMKNPRQRRMSRLVESGMAWHYKQYQRLQNATDKAAYGVAEDQARHAKKGLWSEANPVQPQDFRHGTRSPFCADNNDHRIACSDTYEGPVRGNRRSKIYHWPGFPNYDDIAEHNRIEFANAIEAESPILE